jgi:hypothetical protein
MPQIEGLNQLMGWTGADGYAPSYPQESLGNHMAEGSENAMLTAAGKIVGHKGVTMRGGGAKGGFAMSNVAETFASVGQDSDLSGYGNVMNVFAALFYIGKGLVRLAGQSLLVNASATLSLLIKRSGSYTDPGSGPWQAGLAEPSAPIIRAVTPPAGLSGKVTGTVSVVIWRIRSTTGAVSNHSPVSNIVAASGQSIAITFPLKDANGQDAWGIGVTKQIEGRTGSHFELTEILEAELTDSLTRSDVATNAASLDITSATGGFTSAHIGWTVTLSGGSPALSHSSYVTAVPDANTLTIAALPPSTSTGVTMILGVAVEGTARTAVVEWRDGDLANKPFAPDRDFPPPSALFAGTLEDVLFVDGAYADAVSATSSTVRGTAIAPSEPGRPESFSPDTVIFTDDTPTCLLKGDGLYWRFGRNSVNVIKYLGGEKPLSVEHIWTGIGIDHQHQACLGEGGRPYFWPVGRGLMRVGDDALPEGDFAAPVADDLAACTDAAKRVVGWDGVHHVVVACYEKRAWPYFASLGRWGAPANFEGTAMGNIRSAVTEGNQLLLVDDNDDIWEWNVGTGSVVRLVTPWKPSVGGMDTIAAVVASVRADNTTEPVTLEVFADGDDASAEDSTDLTPTRTGYQRLPAVWPNIIDTESHRVRVTLEGTTADGDVGVESIATYGPSNNALR